LINSFGTSNKTSFTCSKENEIIVFSKTNNAMEVKNKQRLYLKAG
jgi:hypothetical protein